MVELKRSKERREGADHMLSPIDDHYSFVQTLPSRAWQQGLVIHAVPVPMQWIFFSPYLHKYGQLWPPVATLHNVLRFGGLRSAQSVRNVVNNKISILPCVSPTNVSTLVIPRHYAPCTMLNSIKERKEICDSDSTKHITLAF